jgi:hypothetical protein
VEYLQEMALAEWQSERISEAMVVHYDHRGRKVSSRRADQEITLSICQFHDSLLFTIKNKWRKDVFISASASGF